MKYIDKNLLPNEKILFRTKKHIIIFIFPLILTFFSFYADHYAEVNPILIKLRWIPWFITLIFWAYTGLDYMTSEFAVTNRRIMMREGFFYRHTNETRLNTISQVNVNQSLLGQLLNYGTVVINAFGAFDAFTLIAKPDVFQRYVNQEVDQLTR